MKTFKKNHLIKTYIKKAIFIIPLLLITMTISAQVNNGYERAKAEIEAQFGVFPEMFAAFPDHALAGAWDSFKQLQGSDNVIPPKYRELLQLAVASQIPCSYCIYFHTEIAKAHGATKEEIKEAVAHGAQTRHWSMILQGSQIDFKDFKSEFDGMMKYMSEKSKE